MHNPDYPTLSRWLEAALESRSEQDGPKDFIDKEYFSLANPNFIFLLLQNSLCC